jgi:DNA-binding NarL/FixJ family response regulator
MAPPTMNKTIRVLIAEDHDLVLDAITARLNRHENIEVVGAARNGKELIEAYNEMLPDVVVTDIGLPVMDGVEATAAIRAQHPTAKILFLSGRDDQETIAKAISAGASGFVVKTVAPTELTESVVKIANGELVFDQTATKFLMAEVRSPTVAKPDLVSTLSNREMEILKLMADDLTNAEIADALFISPLTVKTHVERILAKLGVRGRVGAVREGIARGILD